MTPEELADIEAQTADSFGLFVAHTVVLVEEVRRCWGLLYPHERFSDRRYEPCRYCGMRDDLGYCAERRRKDAADG